MSSAFYVTTPIYYVNGRPHIGHAYTTIAADALTRWHRLNGRPSFFLTGTDEHGQKVLDKAKERGMEPKAHCDDMVVHWKAMMSRFQIGYDRFFRTTDADHLAVVRGALQKLWDEGQIYRGEFTGWYSKAAERFWTEKDLVDGKCPESGLPVELITEGAYFFRMSRYQQDLIGHIEANPGFIRPESRRNEVLGFLRKELADLCISRPKSRMAWGIELPFDADFVCYVWFDALLNYLTGVGYDPSVPPDVDAPWKAWWPADVQLLGKDILTTHAVYWSTMLMALDVPLPKTIYAHGWWKAADGEKMSKSLGNTVDVELLADAFGVDATRFFFLREIAFGADGGFSYAQFLTRYNADLANDLGNLSHRTLTMAQNWLGGKVPAWGEDRGGRDELLAVAIEQLAAYERAMEGFQLHAALEAAFVLVGAGNKHVDRSAPWALNKAGNADALRTSLRLTLEVALLVAVLLLPFMPAKMGELLGKLGFRAEDAPALLAAFRAGKLLDALPVDQAFTLGDPLFPRHREMPEVIAAMLAAAPPAPVEEKAPKAEKQPKADKPAADAKKDATMTAETETPALIEYADFAKIQLRTGKVLAAEKHPKADKLLVLQVDIGEPSPRTIVAGIASKFAPEALIGRQVVVVANLKPAKLRGIDSQGMLLAAGGAEVIDLVSVDAAPGEVVR